MKYTIENLQKLEAKISIAFLNTKNPQIFTESKTCSLLKKKWSNYMIALRGWDVLPLDKSYDSITRPEWKKYCIEHNIYPNYNFYDILA